RMPVSKYGGIRAAAARNRGKSRMEQHRRPEVLGSGYGVVEKFPDSGKARGTDSRRRVQRDEQFYSDGSEYRESNIRCGARVRECEWQPVRTAPGGLSDEENAVRAEVYVLSVSDV